MMKNFANWIVVTASLLALTAHAAEKTGERFEADGAHLALSLPAARVEALQARLRDATRDRVRFTTPVSVEIH